MRKIIKLAMKLIIWFVLSIICIIGITLFVIRPLLNDIEVIEFEPQKETTVLKEDPDIEKAKELIEKKWDQDLEQKDIDKRYGNGMFFYSYSAPLKVELNKAKETYTDYSHIKLKVKYNFFLKETIDIFIRNEEAILYSNLFLYEYDEDFCKEMWDIFVIEKE